jgi:hypothetical protein
LFTEVNPIYSFVVKIWQEESTTEAGAPRWRGRITHVPSGEKRYFEDLQTIVEFIQSYLGSMGNSPEDID